MTQLPSFNWRDHFSIDDAYGQDKRLLEKAFDDIAATGEDGVALLRQVHDFSITEKEKDDKRNLVEGANLNRELILISPFAEDKDNNRGSHFNPYYRKRVVINPKKPVGVNVGGLQRQASVTGVVVHELFHAADPNVRLDVQSTSENTEKTLKFMIESDTLSLEDRRKVLRAYQIWRFELSKQIGEELREKMLPKLHAAKDAAEAEQLIVQMSVEIAQRTEETTQQNPEAVMQEISKRSGVPRHDFNITQVIKPKEYEQFLNKNEEDAVIYTDTFMKKHFPAEPFRNVYSNGVPLNELKGPIEAARGCGVVLSHYTPETITLSTLGTLSQPPISNKPSPFCEKDNAKGAGATIK